MITFSYLSKFTIILILIPILTSFPTSFLTSLFPSSLLVSSILFIFSQCHWQGSGVVSNVTVSAGSKSARPGTGTGTGTGTAGGVGVRSGAGAGVSSAAAAADMVRDVEEALIDAAKEVSTHL